jgi:HD-like signal output (HDOD) protein
MLVVGLLADLGHLVMYQTVPQLADEAFTRAEANGRTLAESERDIVGCDFTEVGAALCAQWQLPPCFADIIGAQLNPRLAGEFVLEASMVLIADRIVEAERNDETSEDAAQSISAATWAMLGLKAEVFGELRANIELNLAAYLQTLFAGVKSA